MPLCPVIPQLQIILLGFILGLHQPLTDDDIEPSLKKVITLPSEVKETSGLLFYDSLIWTFNDSGNEPILFGIDLKNGEIRKRIHIINSKNTDWEDITQDEQKIFVGDIGNNSGNRQDLNILIINKDSISTEEIQHIKVEKINYSYADQTYFGRQLYSTEYDCEALICFHDSLYLLSKNWIDETTSLYQLPKTAGDYKARKVLDFNCDGLITGADYYSLTNDLVICGNQQYIPFIILFNNVNTLNLNNLEYTRYDFFNEFGLQIEGISIFNKTIYLSNENSSEAQAIFRFIKK